MNRIQDILAALPPMLDGDALTDALAVLPPYEQDVCSRPAAERLMALSDLYRIYVPSAMSVEIYSKLYLAMLRSLQKKTERAAVQQGNENCKTMQGCAGTGILGGSDSFTVIGTSGIGKSAAICRAIDLISQNGVITTAQPYCSIIPCVVVQCPFDCSVKGLLLEILRKVDEHLNGGYYQSALRARATADMLIGSVSQVALNHIGLLVVDEIQNVVSHKHGKSLIGMLTQLINNSGISICMVGTPESVRFFEQAMHLARRSVGLQYGAWEYGAGFCALCRILLSYRYTALPTPVSEGVIRWLYEHSGGIVSVVVSLIHDAQELSILDGREVLDLQALEAAYRQRLNMLHGYLGKNTASVSARHVAPKKEPVVRKEPPVLTDTSEETPIAAAARICREQGTDPVELLRLQLKIVEVAV